jgi:hypothetical protein
MRRRSKQEVCDAFIARLSERGDIDIGATGFIEGVCSHFERLPTRYALDVNTDSLDVLSHKRLLDEARLDPTTVSFAVRSVEVLHIRPRESSDGLPSPAFIEVRMQQQSHSQPSVDALHQLSQCRPKPQHLRPQASPRRGVMHPPMPRRTLPKPAFGSSPNLQVRAAGGVPLLLLLPPCTPSCRTPVLLPVTRSSQGSPRLSPHLPRGFFYATPRRTPGLFFMPHLLIGRERSQALALEFGERGVDTSHDGALADNTTSAPDSTFYEITIATVDQPKLLSRLSDAMVRARRRSHAAKRRLTTPTPNLEESTCICTYICTHAACIIICL